MFIAKHLPLTVAGGVHVASPFLGQENRRSFLIPFSTSASSSLPEEKEKDREMLKKQRKKKTAVVLGGGKIPTWEVYLENDDFFYYTSTVRKELVVVLSLLPTPQTHLYIHRRVCPEKVLLPFSMLFQSTKTVRRQERFLLLSRLHAAPCTLFHR